MVPELTIEASGRPGIWKLKRPAMKSSLRISLVVARKPAVVMTAPGPKMMPSRLTMNTLPLADRLPRIWLGPRLPVTRLSAIELLFGWLNVVRSPTPMSNMRQLMTALSLNWLTVTLAEPAPLTVAEPPTTCAPSGPA